MSVASEVELSINRRAKRNFLIGEYMENHNCDECQIAFTSRGEFEQSDADVVEQKTCDTVDGQYIEWWQIRCPKCHDIIQEYGR